MNGPFSRFIPFLRNVVSKNLSQRRWTEEARYTRVKGYWHRNGATMSTVTHQHATPRPVVRIRNQYEGDDELEEGQPDRLTYLRSQLASIPPASTSLTINEDTPSDTEWDILRGHFTSVNDLELDAGFNEDLNNNIPLDWPLERLSIGSSCGKRISTPWIIEGKIKHLRLHYTCGLRFEGPTSGELMRAHRERIKRGEAKEDKVGHITIIDMPSIAYQWMYDKYGKDGNEGQAQQKEETSDGANNSTGPATEEARVQDKAIGQPHAQIQTKLETLEIIENDAHDTLLRMALGCGNVLDKIKTLYFRATNGCDLHYPSSNVLDQFLPGLSELRSLTLVLANEYEDPKILTELYRHLPLNVETLHFRGPANLAKSDDWPAWVKAFGNPDFHPKLKRLSFVLDLGEERKGDFGQKGETAESQSETNEEGSQANAPPTSQPGEARTADTSAIHRLQETPRSEASPTTEEVSQAGPDKTPDPSPKKEYQIAEEDLRIAKRACEQLLSAAEKRGITLEKFSEPELDSQPIDDRWDKL